MMMITVMVMVMGAASLQKFSTGRGFLGWLDEGLIN
jgi:hypothetical protein